MRRYLSSVIATAVLLAPAGLAGADTAPSFDDGATYSIGPEPKSVAVGDINSDGFTDALVTVAGTTLGGDPLEKLKLVVFEGDGQGGFIVPGQEDRIPTHETDGHLTMDIDTGDVNGDGLIDVALATTKGVDVFYQARKPEGQEKSPGLLPPVLLAHPSAVSRVLIEDVDGRGGQDIVALTADGVFHYKTNEFVPVPGSYTAPPETVGQPGNEIAVADVVGTDGHKDVILMTGSELKIYQAHEEFMDPIPRIKRSSFTAVDGSLRPLVLDPSNDSMTDVAAGDVTGDGLDDIVVTIGSNGPSARINVFPRGDLQAEGLATFGSPIAYDSPGDLPSDVSIADINDDGAAEVVVAHSDAAGIYLRREDGTLASECLVSLPPSQYLTTHMELADFTNDGLLDIAVSGNGVGLGIRRQVESDERIPSLAAQIAPASSVPNQIVGITGRLDLDGACPSAGQFIRVMAVAPDGSRSQLGVTETDAAGRFRFDVAPSAPGTYRYVAAWGGNEDEDLPATESDVLELTVAKVATAIDAGLSGHRSVKNGVRVYRAKKATFTATVRPAQAGPLTVTVDVRRRGSWVRVRTLGVSTDGAGTAILKLGGKRGKTYRVQALLAEDNDGFAAASPALKFRFAK